MKKNRIRKIFSKDILRIRSLTLFLISTLFSLSGNAQKTSVTIQKQQIGIEEAFNIIKAQTKVYIMYENQIIDKSIKINVNLEKASLAQALNEICSKVDLKYEILDKHVLITKPRANNSKNPKRNSIVGQILNEAGEPLPGAIVMIVGKQRGAISDIDGNYKVDAESGEVLRYSFIGMENVEKIVGDENNINVVLAFKSHQLEEVEILSTGYQSLQKDRATGSFSYISSKDLEKIPSPNVIQRLEGQLPGVKLSLFSGDRSFTYNNTLKSANSSTHTVGSSEYAINIRGVSTLSGETFPLIVVDGVITEMDLSSINPDDIENITVLKDAAAASIWGVRAANGVIVVTTKKGQNKNKPQVSFSTSFTIAEKPDISYLKTMTSSEMLEYEKELVDRGILTNVSATSYYTAQYMLPEGSRLALKLKSGTITQDEYNQRISELSQIDNRSQISKYFLQKATSQQYNLSVNGGSNTSDYFYSTSYSKENPNAKKDSGQRLTLTLNNNWKLFNWITLSTKFRGSFFSYANNGTTIGSLYPSSGRSLMPYENIADEKGNGISYDRLDPAWTSTLSSIYKDWTYNYLDELNMRNDKQKTNNFSGNVNIIVPLFKGLTSSSLLAIEKSFSRNTIYYDPDSYYFRNIVNYYTYPTATTNSLGISNGGILSRTNTDETNYSFRQQLNYDEVINGMHRINALAGIELRETNIGQSTFSLFGYNKETGLTNSNINYSSTPTYAWVAGATSTSYTTFIYGGYPNQVDKRRRFLSYYGNAAYTLLDRYSISASVRYDDYNNFGVDRKYRATPLYSFGSKWNISRESFMQNAKWVNNLAIRLTYGINGNLSLDTYPFTKIYLTSDSTTGETSAGISATANPQLRWEKVYTTNVGLDFNLFDNRLSGALDYYSKRSRDLLYDSPIGSAYVGTISNTSIRRNSAAIDSHGLETNLNVVTYKDKDWQAIVGMQLSYNTNKVKENIFFKENSYANYYSYYPLGVRLVEGYSTDKLLVYRNAGLDKEGFTQIYDENGGIIKSSTTSITSFKVLKNAGRTTAPYFGGVNLNIKYKQLSLYALATYQFGNVFLKPTINNYVSSTYNARFDVSADIAKRWKSEGDENTTYIPKASSNIYSLNRYIYSDVNVLKGDYIRLREISVSYQLNNELINKVHARSAQISLSVNNLGFLWRANKQGYDPDYISSIGGTSSLPPSKSYVLSLNINF